ncbi:unnamed protein product, partial [Polarella glacialis]
MPANSGRRQRGRDKSEKSLPKPKTKAQPQAPRRTGFSFRWAGVLTCLVLLQAAVGFFFWHSRRISSKPVSLTEERPRPAEFLAPPKVLRAAPVPGSGLQSGSLLAAFAAADAPIPGNLENQTAEIAILVIASGRRLQRLRDTLKSLSRVDGLKMSSVLVSQASPGEASRRAVQEEFGLAWVGPLPKVVSTKSLPPLVAGFEQEAKPFEHYRRSLDHAVRQHFRAESFRSLLVLEEELVFSPDLLTFSAQLEPLLFKDRSLWCISAWNDNGLAPYTADLTVVLRTDWFSGVGWLARLDDLRSDLLPAWPGSGQHWRSWVRRNRVDAQQQCLIPEVSRAAFATVSCDSAGLAAECGDEEIAARQLSAKAVMSSAMSAHLGDVRRLEASNYQELFTVKWPASEGLALAAQVASPAQLQELLQTRKGPRALLLALALPSPQEVTAAGGVQQATAGLWAELLTHFSLLGGGWGPRVSYKGVIRLRWGDSILFLAASDSPLLKGPMAVVQSSQPVSAMQFSVLPTGGLRSTGVKMTLPIAPQSTVSASVPGASCARHCEGVGGVCVDADLAAVASCVPPLTTVLKCSQCSDKAKSSAFPGMEHESGKCFAGVSISGAKGAMTGDCGASAPDVRRLCVCRTRQGDVPVRLQSLSRYFQQAAGTSSQRLRSFQSARENRGQAEVSRFARRAHAPVSAPSARLRPGELPVVVIALAAERETPDDLSSLRATLASLAGADGFSHKSVLVAHESRQLAAVQLVEEEFGMQRVEVPVSKLLTDQSKRSAALHKAALLHALGGIAKQASAVLVLTEGMRVSPDVLWYFVQLEGVLHQDKSLLAVSGWNDNGLAPYVADPTVVLRTDWFSGIGWLVQAQTLREELIPQWPTSDWERIFQSPKIRKGRQFLLPEVSRVVPSSAWLERATLASGIGDQRALRGGDGRGDHASLQSSTWEQTPLCSYSMVDLGDVSRLLKTRYRELFFKDWPGEGLLNTKLLTSIRPIVDGRINAGGPWRLVFRNIDPETDTTWRAIASFFSLWPELPIRTAYHGVVRLRWRDSVLYLVPQSSLLASGSFAQEFVGDAVENSLSSGQATESIMPVVKSQIVDPMLFFASARPVLLPANAEVVAAAVPGTSCQEVCAETRHTCLNEDLFFVNNCAALAGAFGCSSGCEPSE